MNDVIMFALVALVTLGITILGCGLVWLLYVLSYSKPVDKDSQTQELTKRQLDAVTRQILENEKEYRAWRWRYITAGSNARYL